MNAPGQVGIGTPLSRVDGVAKVTGQARYAAEHPVEGLLYGVMVSSAIARGDIVAIRDAAARAVPGVVEVLTHENRPRMAMLDHSYRDEVAPGGSPFRPLGDAKIRFAGQPIALVLADTFEAARYAAALVEVDYAAEPHNLDLAQACDEAEKAGSGNGPSPKPRGDADGAFAAAPLKVDVEFHLAPEHHNAMELNAATAEWHPDGSLTVHDKTQGPQNIQGYLAGAFGMRPDKIRVLNPYVGGAFGSALRPNFPVYLATMAALKLERAVRVVSTRQQMFAAMYRPEAVQHVKLGAEADGRLTAIVNRAVSVTSRFENYTENIVSWGLINYACPNATAVYRTAPIDTNTTGPMRAPGAATGMTLFEMAVDEMAYAAGVDPLEFRLLNYSDIDAMNGTPFTSKALRQAYAQGAEAFGWARRSSEPGSMRDGKELVGWGVATGIWDALFSRTSAKARLSANGSLEVSCATSDIGTGTYTVMTQIACEALGLPPENVTARLGDSSLPTAPVEGGSWGAASTGAAVRLACRAVAEKLLAAAPKVPGNPLGTATPEQVEFVDGRIRLRASPAHALPIVDIMRAAGLTAIEEEATADPHREGPRKQRKSRNTHSAVFAEVRVDEDLGVIRVTRIVNAVAAGRIINPKTARSQIIGGVVMGIGMALHEESMKDLALGRFMNHNLAEYHVPANADVHSIDVIFVDEPDAEVTPLGVKGVGEIGTVSTAAAIANAIFHATGKRIRSLPITIDKLLA